MVQLSYWATSVNSHYLLWRPTLAWRHAQGVTQRQKKVPTQKEGFLEEELLYLKYMMRMGFSGNKKGELESHWRPTMTANNDWMSKLKRWTWGFGNSLASSHGWFWALRSSLHLYVLLWLGLREEDIVWRRTSRFSLHVNSMSEAFHSMCSDCHQTGDWSHMVNVNCQPWQSLGASLLEIVPFPHTDCVLQGQLGMSVSFTTALSVGEGSEERISKKNVYIYPGLALRRHSHRSIKNEFEFG